MVLRNQARLGISRIALTSALLAVVAVAGIAIYVTSAPAGTSPTTRTTSSSNITSVPALTIGITPESPLIAPGQTQNYSSISITALGPGLNGTLVIKAIAPAGISLLLSKTSVFFAGVSQSIPFALRADNNISPGKYNATVDASSTSMPPVSLTFTIDVVPVLVIIQNEAFHPENITVPVGTSVSWINLDSNIGCCDPGNHNVVFLSGANASSPTLRRLDGWSYTFGGQGVVEYYCSIHPLVMKGQVTVTG
jgi:plastocyanin